MKAIVLLSGGLDSTVCMAVAKEQNCEIYPLSFNYHQRHSVELNSAKNVAEHFKVKKHFIVETNMNEFGTSSLTDLNIDVPINNEDEKNIPNTYVPARNLIFLSYALGYAEAVGAEKIFIGVNAVDYSGYPDCRPEFIELFQNLADYSTKAAIQDKKKVKIETPLISLTKKEIVLLGQKLNAPLHLTHSCYNGGEEACGVCDSCRLRLKGFEEAGYSDPIKYK